MAETSSSCAPKGQSWYASLLSDNSGGYSVIRVIACVWSLVVLAAWTIACWHAKALAEVPVGQVTLTSAIWAVKGLQRFGEKDVPDPVAAPPIAPPVV